MDPGTRSKHHTSISNRCLRDAFCCNCDVLCDYTVGVPATALPAAAFDAALAAAAALVAATAAAAAAFAARATCTWVAQ